MTSPDPETDKLIALERRKLQEELKAEKEKADIEKSVLREQKKPAKTSSGIKEAIGKILGNTSSWLIKGIGIIVVILVILMTLNYFSAVMYNKYALVCKDKLNTQLELEQINNKIITFLPILILKNPGFSFCLFSSGFKEIIIDAKWLGNFKLINLLDEQIMTATGSYYYKEVDENAKEPLGVFIDNVKINPEGYPADQDIRIGATVSVKTVGAKIQGIADCTINQISATSKYPSAGTFTSTKSDILPIIWCDFDKNSFSPGVYPASIAVKTKLMVFGHMLPTAIARQAYEELSDENKEKLLSRLQGVTLKTSNTPVQIGSLINTDNQELLIVEESDIKTGIVTLPLGFALDASGWDNGEVKKVHTLYIALPQGVELEDKSKDYEAILEQQNNELYQNKNTQASLEQGINSGDSVTACGGYRFKKVQDCTSTIGTDAVATDSKFLCDESSTIYSLQQNNENDKHIPAFKGKTNFLCGIVTTPDFLFSDEDGNQVLTKPIPIRIYSTYSYEIKNIQPIKITGGEMTANQKLIQTTCEDKIHATFEQTQGSISQVTLDKYAKKYQTHVKSAVHKYSEKITTLDTVQAEALSAAIGAGYSRYEVISGTTDIDQDGIIDFVTGCRMGPGSTDQNEISNDIQCAVNTILPIIKQNNGDIAKSLEVYYAKKPTVYTPGKTATLDDYHMWLKALCKPKEKTMIEKATDAVVNKVVDTAVNKLAEGAQNEMNSLTSQKKGLGELCLEHDECISSLCRIMGITETNPDGKEICALCSTNEQCNEGRMIQKYICSPESTCIVPS